MITRLSSTKVASRLAKFILTGSVCALLGTVFPPEARAVDGTWVNTDNASSLWSDTANWLGANIGDGADSTVGLVYFPTYSITGTTTDLGAIITLDGARTAGNIVMEDLENWGSASVSIVNNAVSQTLTLDTTTGVPTILVGQNLNSIFGGKKAILNTVIIAGSDGFRKTGPGFLGLRQAAGVANNHTFTGDLRAEGGVLQMASQTVYAGQTVASGGSTLFLDFANGNAPATNIINVASALVLGSNGGGGITRGGTVLINSNKAATSNAAQTWSGTTLNEGANQIRLVSNTNQNLTYSLGTVTRNAGSIMDFSRNSVNGTVTVNATIANGANGILGGWAIFSNTGNTTFDWAVNNGSNVIAPLAAGSYVTNAFGAGLHSNLTLPAPVASVAAGTVVNTVKINNGIALNIGLAGSLTVESGGVLVAQQSPAITGGSVLTGEANGELVLHSYGGGTGLRLDTQLVDNGATPLKLIKAGTGQVTLLQNNSYTGTTYVGGGTLQIGNGVGGSATGSIGAGDVFLNGFNQSNAAYQPSGTLLYNRSGTVNVANNISGTGNLAQSGSGTLVLNKQFNVRNLQGLAGTVRMDFNAAGAPASEIINSTESAGTVSLATGSLLLRGSTLEILGKDGAASTQSFGLTAVTGAGRIAVTPGAGGSVTLNLGTLGKFHNSNDGGGTLRLDLPASGVTVTAPNGGGVGQTQQNALIVDLNTPWVTIGNNDWAAKDATLYNAGNPASSVNIVRGSSLAGFHTLSSGGIFTGNLDIDNSPAIAATSVLSSMRFNAAGANTVTVGAGAFLEPHGILVGTGVGAADVTIAGAGSIRGADDATNTARDLPVIQNNTAGNLVITAPIVNFDADTRTTLVKSGAGALVLNNGGSGTVTHTYTDRTLVNEGALQVGAGTLIGTTTTRTGSILIRGSSVIVESTGRINTGAFASVGQRIGEIATLTLKDSGIFDVAADFNVGDVSAKGTLNIQDSAQLLTRSFFIGKSGFAEGIVNLSGGGSIIAANTPAGEWNLGGNGASDPTARGTMNQSGASTFNLAALAFQIGRNGIGEYNLSGTTATVTGTGFHVIGRFVSGVGNLNISGSGSWNANPGGAGQNFFIVGESGTGTITMSGGGLLTAKNLSIAHNGGVGTVNVNGGTIDLQNTALIGTIQAGVVFGQTNAPGTPLASYGGSLNLNGGTLKTFGIRENPSLTTPVSSIVTFDGGTVQAKGANATFMQGLDSVVVEDGGGIVDTNAFDITIAQGMVHDAGGPALDGGLDKISGGILTLSGVNTYTGSTDVLGGTLSVTGSVAGDVNVSGGATLIGTGTIGGAVSVLGTVAPGLSPGALTLLGGAFTLAPAATSNFELGGTGVGQFDELNGIGAFVLDGIFNVSYFGGFNPVLADTFDLVDFASINAAGFNVATDLLLPALDPGLAWDSTSFTTNGTITVVAAVPEPGAAALLLLGALSLVSRRKRQ